MNLKERVYSVLLVSEPEKLNNALVSVLTEVRCQPVKAVSSVSAARRAWSEGHFDFVIVNSPLPDDFGMTLAADICGSTGASVLLLVRAELYGDMKWKAAECGAFVLPKPVSRNLLTLALNWMAAARERLRRMEKKNISVEEKMAEIRIVNRAKWLLISKQNMDEPSAHRYIEKQAMDRCVSKREIAEEILRKYSD